MDISRYKASLKLAQLRYDSDPSEQNKAILDKAQEDFDYANDPEKKTEEGDQDPTPPATKVVEPKPARKVTPLKDGQPKPGAKIPEAPKQPAAPATPAVTPGTPPQTESQSETSNQEENQENQEKSEE